MKAIDDSEALHKTQKRKIKCMKYSTILGSLLVSFPHGLYLYWGNMSIYSLSYIVNVLHSTSNVDTPWIISVFFAFFALGVMTTNYIKGRFGYRSSVFLGVLGADIGLFSSYFTVQNSVVALMCSLSVIFGYGTGLINGSVLSLVVEWADDDVGMLTALVQSGFSIGGVLINEFVTLYTNPQDLTPRMKLGRVQYFTQKEILDRIPSIYLILGGFSASVHIMGLLMLRQKPKQEIHPFEELNSDINYLTFNKTCINSGKIPNIDICETSMESIITNTTAVAKEDKSSNDYHPKEMLKTVSFYVLWMSISIADIPWLLFTNYYKFYGQLWIHDDHLLTVLGTTSIVLNIFVSVLWGAAMDKTGVKNCFVVLMSSTVIILSWFYFSPMLNDWIYFIVTLLFSCSVESLYPIFTATTALLYGKTHFSTNYGFMLTSTIALNILAPYILKSILFYLGWFALFASASGISLISLILILLFVPRI